MDKAGVYLKIELSDLRRTGTMEMVDAGVSMGQIMSVTGHVQPQSVKPYLKNTFASANNALKLRKMLMDKNTKNDDFIKEMEDFLKRDDENMGHFHADKFILSEDFEIRDLTDDDLSYIRQSAVRGVNMLII